MSSSAIYSYILPCFSTILALQEDKMGLGAMTAVAFIACLLATISTTSSTQLLLGQSVSILELLPLLTKQLLQVKVVWLWEWFWIWCDDESKHSLFDGSTVHCGQFLFCWDFISMHEVSHFLIYSWTDKFNLSSTFGILGSCS